MFWLGTIIGGWIGGIIGFSICAILSVGKKSNNFDNNSKK
jgi:hypothetical protein